MRGKWPAVDMIDAGSGVTHHMAIHVDSVSF